MGCLHFIQGGLMLFFALSVTKITNFKIPLMTYFLTFDKRSVQLVTDPKMIGQVPFAIFVSLFLFISAAAHFLIVLPKLNDIYNNDLKKRINRFRWYEYALSSSLMIVLIAMLFGMYDLGSLIILFLLNASMNLFGLLMELLNQYTKKTNWLPFIFGSISGLGTWVVIFIYALGNSDPSEVPWFVYAILASYFVFFNLFPINMVLQYKRIGKWSNYIYGERTYILLSLIAKTVLAWLVFSGVMQP
ncbi:hypothetical protein BCR26_09495 [Enterococcus rivorum]|uniref:Heliorhodopsin HeR n=2 Tax=Enterococcus rivorum TaxID=762845 RepID=A0A1E5L013_9ENTE|nr:hypothetical protein BCR26_09495 [Enterococcus rivorum]